MLCCSQPTGICKTHIKKFVFHLSKPLSSCALNSIVIISWGIYKGKHFPLWYFFCGEGFLRMSFNVLCITVLETSLSKVLCDSRLLPASLPPYLCVCPCLSGFSLLLSPFWFLVAGLHRTGVKTQEAWSCEENFGVPPAHLPDSPRQSQKLLCPAGMAFIHIGSRGHFVLKSMHVVTVWQ